MKDLKAKGIYWEKLLAATVISRSRKAAYKYYTAVIHSRRMLNKIAVYTQEVFNYPYKNLEIYKLLVILWTPSIKILKASLSTLSSPSKSGNASTSSTKKSMTRLTMTTSQQILLQQMHIFESLFRTSIIFRDSTRLSYYIARLAAPAKTLRFRKPAKKVLDQKVVDLPRKRNFLLTLLNKI